MKRTLLVSLPMLMMVLVLGMQTGCGPSGPDIDTFPVTGVVKLNGVPVQGALVSFVPDAGKYSPAATTDMTGKYTLNTMGVDGAPVGSYKVKILKQNITEAAPAAPTASSGSGMPPDENEEDDPEYAGDEAEQNTEEVGNMLPAKYASESTSGLTAVVKEGENTFDFDMN